MLCGMKYKGSVRKIRSCHNTITHKRKTEALKPPFLYATAAPSRLSIVQPISKSHVNVLEPVERADSLLS